MKRFKYVAYDINGKKYKSTLESPSRELAVSYLNNRSLQVKKIDEVSSLFSNILNVQLSKVINDDELIRFLKNMAVLISSGLRVHEALEVMCHQAENKEVRKVYFSLYFSVLEGDTLSEAMSLDKKNFPNILVNLIRSGERTSNIVEVLNSSAEYFEKKKEISKETKSIFAGPVIYLAMLIGVSIFIMVSVLPIYSDIYASLGAVLPIYVRIFISMSNFVAKYWLYMLGGIVVIILLIWLIFFLNPKGKRAWDYGTVKLPLFKKLIKLYYESFISKTLCTLTKNKISTIDSINLLIPIVKNNVYKDVLQNISDTLMEGFPITTTLYNSTAVDELFKKMLSIGERSGNLANSFENLDTYYDKTVILELQRIKKRVTPVLMIVIYACATLLVLVVMLPTLSIINQI